MTDKELLSLGLPKWPQMIVTGETVSIDQAREVIRRTDNFFIWGGGNHHEWNKYVKKTLGMPDDSYEARQAIKDDHDKMESLYETRDKFLEKWEFIYLGYICNSWISCSCAQGPQGWMHPDGHIDYHYNVGKWPEVEDIYNEWKIVAQAFPFLKLEVTLMDGEYCEDDTKRVVSMLVRDGSVTLVDPALHDIHAESGRAAGPFYDNTTEQVMALIMGGKEKEIGIPKHWIPLWAEEFQKRQEATA